MSHDMSCDMSRGHGNALVQCQLYGNGEMVMLSWQRYSTIVINYELKTPVYVLKDFTG